MSDDEVQELLLLSSLPDGYKTLVVSISNSAPNRSFDNHEYGDR